MPAETVVDIVLEVPEIFHGNVCCCLPICDLLIIPDWNILQIFRKQKLEVFYKSNRSTLINAVMKYLNFRSSASKLESIKCKFINSRTPSEVSFEEFHSKCRTAIFKNALRWLLLGTTFFCEIFLNGCFSKTAVKIYLF